MRVLLVEDDAKIAKFVQKGFQEAGIECVHEAEGKSGLACLLAGPFDVAVVDVMLPGLDGLALIQESRAQFVDTPCLILSAKRSVEERVSGLRSGGDDYLVKPFAFSELLARTEALVRRNQTRPELTELRVHDITLNLRTRQLYRNQKPIELQPKEFSLLELFMRNTNRVLSKSFLLKNVWNYNFDPQTNIVDVLVCRLRNKLDRESNLKSIQTIRGVGYVLKT